MKFCPVIDLFFTDHAWEQRVESCAACGFRYVETWKGSDAAELKRMNGSGVQLVSTVLNYGHEADVAPVNRANLDRFLERIDRTVDCALAAGCRQGIVTTGPQLGQTSYQAQRSALVAALARAGELVRDRGFLLNLEPLNTEVNHAGYMLSSPADAIAIVKECGSPQVKVLYDIYHTTITIGNQTALLQESMPWIGHFHTAGVPGRHEPYLGETNYPFLLAEIEKCGYQGYVGLEYLPTLPFAESLRKSLQYFTSPNFA